MCKIMQEYETAAEERMRISILKGMLKNGISFELAMKAANIDPEEWQKYRILLAT